MEKRKKYYYFLNPLLLANRPLSNCFRTKYENEAEGTKLHFPLYKQRKM